MNVVKFEGIVSRFFPLVSVKSSSKRWINSRDPFCSFTLGSNFLLMSSIKKDFPDPHLKVKKSCGYNLENCVSISGNHLAYSPTHKDGSL